MQESGLGAESRAPGVFSSEGERRPKIPAELRRRILVEAGHRCAIPTCRHIEVDVHHIIPWEKVRKHSYANLIALCPNCHRRATSGEIDRKSLLMYKGKRGQVFTLDICGESDMIGHGSTVAGSV
jgi:5-methylcytosine-specific restriction endonuclease McrA